MPEALEAILQFVRLIPLFVILALLVKVHRRLTNMERLLEDFSHDAKKSIRALKTPSSSGRTHFEGDTCTGFEWQMLSEAKCPDCEDRFLPIMSQARKVDCLNNLCGSQFHLAGRDRAERLTDASPLAKPKATQAFR